MYSIDYGSRVLKNYTVWSVEKNENCIELEEKQVRGNGSAKSQEWHIETLYQEQKDGVYQWQYICEVPFDANGMSVAFRLRNWKSIRYLAIGYTYEGKFKNVRLAKPLKEQWSDFSIGFGDLAFGLQNNWQFEERTKITDIRLYLSASTEESGACIDIKHISLWEETPNAIALQEYADTTRDTNVQNAMLSYMQKSFRNTDKQAQAFLEQGLCPLYGETLLAWDDDKPLPNSLLSNGTYRFSWHSLHPATILTVYAHKTNDQMAVMAARDFISLWLERSYYNVDEDQKFAWYDHGTAERLMAFLLFYMQNEKTLDKRFSERLRVAIFRHAQLLSSELFYAYHQPMRYHNHAWFQDIALMCVALTFREWNSSQGWLECAIERFEDQIAHLITREHGYAVMSENAIGYHIGARRIIDFAAELAKCSGMPSSLVDVSCGMERFESLMCYPKTKRYPTFGDTFLSLKEQVKKHIEEHCNGCFVLEKSGYAVVRGTHEGELWMLSVIASSQTKTHKHEDNLSFTLFFEGKEWLLDPSFYSHDYADPIPAYLRSHVAHNALVLRDQPYSITPGVATIREDEKNGDEDFAIRGEHRCYAQNSISRRISGKIDSLRVNFLDEIEGKVRDGASLMFHCGLGVDVTCSQDGFVMLSHKDSDYCLVFNIAYDACKIYRGGNSDDELYGMTGTGFMQSTEIVTIEFPLMGQSHQWSITASSVEK